MPIRAIPRWRRGWYKPTGFTSKEPVSGALATNFITPYHSLLNVARLSSGESVLIHPGAGGTGQAAIQIAQHCGAEVFTTVGSSSKIDLLIDLYNIPAWNILNSRNFSFAEEIKRLMGNRGVDVVLNSPTGETS